MGNYFRKLKTQNSKLKTYVGLIFAGLMWMLVTSCGDQVAISTLTISPSSVTVGVNGTQLFTAIGYDASGKSYSSLNVTWSVSGSIGTISSAGILTAASSAGSGAVTATYSGVSGSSAVTITTKGIISGTITNAEAEKLASISVNITSIGTATAYSYTAVTNSSGVYSATEVPTGEYVVATVGNVTYVPSSTEAQVITGTTTTVNFALSRRLTITSDDVSNLPIVTGYVKNNGTTTATGITVTYYFYDLTGALTGGGTTTVGSLTAGASSSFSILTTQLTADYSSKTSTAAATSF